MKIQRISNITAKQFIWQHHYARICPSTIKASYGVGVNGKLKGVIICGYGVRPKHTIDKWFPSVGVERYLELNRFCLLDEMPRNTESQVLSWMINQLKRDFPHVEVLLSWADGLRGKPGYVYQACSWWYGGYINSEFYTDQEGYVIHPRLLITRYGTRGKGIQKRLKLKHYFGRQFMYCKFLCSRKRRKELLKKSPMDWRKGNYPKQKDIVFEMSDIGGLKHRIDYTPTMKGRNYKIELDKNKTPQQSLFAAEAKGSVAPENHTGEGGANPTPPLSIGLLKPTKDVVGQCKMQSRG